MRKWRERETKGGGSVVGSVGEGESVGKGLTVTLACGASVIGVCS